MAVIYVGIAWLIGLALGAFSESLFWLWLWVGLAGLAAVCDRIGQGGESVWAFASGNMQRLTS